MTDALCPRGILTHDRYFLQDVRDGQAASEPSAKSSRVHRNYIASSLVTTTTTPHHHVPRQRPRGVVPRPLRPPRRLLVPPRPPRQAGRVLDFGSPRPHCEPALVSSAPHSVIPVSPLVSIFMLCMTNSFAERRQRPAVQAKRTKSRANLQSSAATASTRRSSRRRRCSRAARRRRVSCPRSIRLSRVSPTRPCVRCAVSSFRPESRPSPTSREKDTTSRSTRSF